MFDLAISLVILAALALGGGAIFLYRRGQKKQAGLMALLVLIMVANVAIWLMPTADGDSLAETAARSE